MVNSGEVVWVDVLPSLRGFGARAAKEAAGSGTVVGKQMQKELDAAAEKAGISAGQKLSKGLEEAQARAKKVGQELKSARDKEADAAGKLRVAEEKLAEVRNTANAKTSAIAAAEERAATARRSLSAATDRITETSERHAQALRNAKSASDAITLSTQRAAGEVQIFGHTLRQVDDSRIRSAHGSMLKFAGVSLLAAKGVALLGQAAPAIGGIGAGVAAASGSLLLLPAMAAGAGAAFATVKLGVAGMGDAMKAVAEGDVKKLDEAVKGLAPSARATVRELAAIKPQFDKVQDAVQQKLFEGISAELRPLANTYLPLANAQLGAMATMFNANALGALAFAQEAQTVSDVNTTLGNTNYAMGQLTGAVVALLPAFRDIMAVGSEFFPNLTGGAIGAAQGFSQMIARMRESGELAAIMSRGLSVLGDIALVAKNLGSILVSVFSAANQSGFGFFGTLAMLTGEVARFLKSAEGSAMLTTIFATIRGVVEGLLPGLRAVGSAVAQGIVAIGPALPAVAQAFSAVAIAVAPLILDLANMAASILPPLAALITNMAPVIGALTAAFVSGYATIRAYNLAIKGLAFIQGVIGFVKGLTTAQYGLNAAMRANVIGIIVTAIAALVAGFVYLWNNSAGFRDFWIGIWEAIKGAALWAWTNVLQPTFTAISTAVQAVGSFFVWLWQDVMVPAWDGIVAAATWAWNNILKPIFTALEVAIRFVAGVLYFALVAPFVLAWNILAAAAQFVWNTILKPIFDGIAIVATWLWHNALQPAFNGIAWAFDQAVAGIAWAWNNLLKPAWDAIGFAATWLWQNILMPAFNGIKWAWDAAIFGIVWVWNNILKPAWDALMFAGNWMWLNVLMPAFNGIKWAWEAAIAGIVWIWNNILKPAWDALSGAATWMWEHVGVYVFGGLKAAFEGVGNAFSWVWSNVIKPVWDALSGAVSWVWNNVLKPVWDAFGTAINTVGDFFNGLGDTVKRIWDGIQSAIKGGIQFVIDLVWNNSLLKVYEAADTIAMGSLPDLGPVYLARGGVLSGYAPGRDTVPAMLSPGEAVLVPELVRMLGVDVINAANRAARGGRSAGGVSAAGLQGYADGGVVGAPTPSGATSDSGAAPGVLTVDPAATQAAVVAVDALNLALVALATTINTLVVPALLAIATTINTISVPALVLLTWHTGTGAVLANTAFQWSTLALQMSLFTAWTAITAHVLLSHSMIAARQFQLGNELSMSWAFIASAVWASVNQQNAAFGALANGMSNLRAAMTATADWAAFQYGRTYEAARAPVAAVLHGPFNAGLIAAWNRLDADFAFGKQVAPVAVPFATGGRVRGPGSGTSDSIPAYLSNGEFVMREDITRRTGPFLEALNAGQPEAMQAAGVGRYAEGGLVDIHGQQVGRAIGEAAGFARRESGKPYIWGGVGPAGYDCSGLMSAITNVLRGQGPHRRLGVARSQPWPGFAPGLGSAFATGYSQGHTAGTLAGVNVESGGSPSRVKYGVGAVGADHSQFGGHAFLPIVGGSFVSGGEGAMLDPRALVDGAFADAAGMINGFAGRFPGNRMAEVSGGVAAKAMEAMKGKAVEKIAAMFAATGGGGAGAEQWRGVVLQALAMVGQPASLADTVLRRLHQESGGDARAMNGWDVNAKRGTPSKGLMQVIDPTFRSNWDPRTPNDIWNPLSNIVASMRYAMGRYGSLSAAYNRAGGYDNGGWLQPGYSNVYNGTGKPELVLTNPQAHTVIDALTRGGDGAEQPVVINVYPQPGQSEQAIAEAVSRRLKARRRT